MEYDNDYKLRSIKRIFLRNLYLELESKQERNGKHTDVTTISPRKEEVIGRRRSLFQSITQFDEITNIGLLHINTLKLVDSFFTLHVPYMNEDLLVYVSEDIASNMNPNFRQITLPTLPNCNSPNLILKIWCKTSQSRQWKLFYKYDIDLSKLWYIGDSLIDTENYFHSNSVIFNLNDRYYTIPGSLIVDREKMIDSTSSADSKHILPSYSFDSIRSLNSISRSLKELMKSKNKISIQINESVNKSKDSLKSLSNSDNINIEQEMLSTENARLDKYIERQESINDRMMSDIIAKRIQISHIKQAINGIIPSKIEMATNHIEVVESQIAPIRESLSKQIYPTIVQNLQEATHILKEIIFIENFDNSIKFTIMGLEFPLSIKDLLDICYYNKYDLHNYNTGELKFANELESHQMKVNQINAGLNYIVQLINNIALITNANLKYKMYSYGNLCYVLDPIRSDSNQNLLKYPLYYDQGHTLKLPIDRQRCDRKLNLQNKGFEVGLELLNRNLISLINDVANDYDKYYKTIKKSLVSDNIPVDCLDNFLWNLQYLVLFITAPTNVESV